MTFRLSWWSLRFPAASARCRPISIAGRASSRTRTAIPPKFESKKVKGKNVEVTRGETSGHYHPPQFPGLPPSPIGMTPGLLGAIVVTDKVTLCHQDGRPRQDDDQD